MPEVANGAPELAHPPVVEVAIAIEFLPMADLGAVHLADLVRQWRPSYPRVDEGLATPPSRQPSDPGLTLALTAGFPGVRLRLASPGGEALVQIQNDRLILNWREPDPAAAYPRFVHLQRRFEELWNDLVTYTTRELDDRPLPIIAEVTYVNVVETLDDDLPGSAFTLLSREGLDQRGPGAVRFQHELPVDGQGTTTSGGHVVITAEPKPDQAASAHYFTVSTRLTISGTPDADDVHSALDRAHALAVSAFVGATRPEYHRAWGAQQP